MHAELFSRSKTLISSGERKPCTETSDPFSLSLSSSTTAKQEELLIGFSDES